MISEVEEKHEAEMDMMAAHAAADRGRAIMFYLLGIAAVIASLRFF